jgi:RimJ/RimL family protein N-acetyltransferase
MRVRQRLRQYWPLFGLELRTPRLLLTPISDDHLPDLLEAELAGIHDPDQMPFDVPWSIAPPEELIPNSLKHYWAQRSAHAVENWHVQFAVLLDGRAIGVQDLRAERFSVARGVETGSWIRQSQQRVGVGTEMRAAVLMFAFDHLGALRAESAAFIDNPSSRRVSAKLGYQPNGRQWKVRREGEVVESEQLLVTPETFVRPEWTVEVSGLEDCRVQLGW